MLSRILARSVLAVGCTVAFNGLAAGGDTPRKAADDGTTHRLDMKNADRDRDAIEEVCRKRRLFKRRYAAETYYAPPVEYAVPAPPASVEPPRADPPTLPMPTSPATYRYDGGPTPPKPMPPRLPAAPPAPKGPTLGPAPTPSERMVATPPARKDTYPAYGDHRRDDTVLLRGTRR